MRAGKPPGAANGYSLQARGVLDASTPQEFLALLDALRRTRKLSYAQIGAAVGKGMSRSTAQAMIKRETLPPLPQLRLFLRGCRVSAEETALWVNTWHHLNRTAPPEPPPAAGGSRRAGEWAAPPLTGRPIPDDGSPPPHRPAADGRPPASAGGGRPPASAGGGRSPATAGDRTPASPGGDRLSASAGGGRSSGSAGGGRVSASAGGGRPSPPAGSGGSPVPPGHPAGEPAAPRDEPGPVPGGARSGPWETTWVAEGLRPWPLVRALAALGALVGMLTGSAVAMWRAGVPAEVILAVYGVIAVGITSWAAVARHHRVESIRRRTPYEEDPGIFLDPMQKVAPPVIGR
ncbi:helix-turn-helix domain-containing protein [Saccharothrix syringae]|uniref:Transcriptional regulator n=1 Tax=Saccharothrix syringae TaxID=103733 RepID=A0A5Q0H298_SACSY|nr:helix-turn-helix transcriptional regulator [Saccharothrix syringae]QFZ20311.1 transcriptional regulator [Saccharothrix syringae]